MAMPIALCADDFGMSEGIDAAILDLITAGRLSATSVMAAGEHLEAGAPSLLSLADKADIGLHLTFTDLPPLTPLPHVPTDGSRQTLGPLIRLALRGRLDRTAVTQEVNRQIDRFTTVFGRKPDFIDGHQHVHILPVIRDAVFFAFEEGRLDRRQTWMRNPATPFTRLPRLAESRNKALIVTLLATGLAGRARRAGIATNMDFRGFTDFRSDGSYGAALSGQFAGIGQGTLFMCHPGRAPGPTLFADGIMAARADEYTYLASDRFIEDLARHGLRLERFSRMIG